MLQALKREVIFSTFQLRLLLLQKTKIHTHTIMAVYKFGVIRTLTRDAKLFVCGSTKELGNWNLEQAVMLDRRNYVLNEPSFWTNEVQIDSEGPFEYKYVTTYCDDGSAEWEGCGSKDNRSSLENECDQSDHREGNRYLLTPSWWIESAGVSDEIRHTTAFYYDRVVCHGQGMLYDKVSERLWLGSCPRQPHHLDTLTNLGVDTIMTLQTESDIQKNCCNVFGGSPTSEASMIDYLEKVYRKLDLALVWLPTADMSTPARRRILPEAVFLLKALLENNRAVYVHCNAGVGRAAAVVAGYLMYVRGMTLKEMMYYLYEKRPAVYVDRLALTQAKKDFILKYASPK